ncbi:MAG: hypothetical protein Q9P01_07205 [Anaerolineae bacterium]|nr:hypothetical protein [Anaerolineae bacterium]MDQ7034613.1 hypothetical protein [Anaerolineae bacterium]
MKKIILLVLGLVLGFLIAEILRRPTMQRLTTLEAKEARSKARYAQYDREWQKEFANMPFDDRMDYELFEAGLKRDGWIGDGDEETN